MSAALLIVSSRQFSPVSQPLALSSCREGATPHGFHLARSFFARRSLLTGSASHHAVQPESNGTFSFTAKEGLDFVNVRGGFTL
jgi:hypothetical protein